MNRGTPQTTSLDIMALKKSVAIDPGALQTISKSKLKAFFKPSEKGFLILHNDQKYCLEVSREKLDYREKSPTGITIILYTPQTKRLLVNDVERNGEAHKRFFARLATVINDITNGNAHVYIREDVI
jgi:hypothetical protein